MRKDTLIALLAATILFIPAGNGLFAGFFDELLEKGKQKAKEEFSKEVQKIIPSNNQPPPPGGSLPEQQGRPGSQPGSTGGERSANDYGFALPRIVTALGFPVLNWTLDSTMMQEQSRQIQQIQRYLDYLNPESFESYAECYAANYLPQAELGKYLSEKTIDGISRVRATDGGIYKALPHVSFRAKFWRGTNEFETARSRQAFLDENTPKFRAEVVQLPAKAVFVIPTDLGQYSFDEGKFNVRLGATFTNQSDVGQEMSMELIGLCGGSRRLKIPISLIVSRQGMVGWQISPDKAEPILARIPNHHAYWGMAVELAIAPGAEASEARGRIVGPLLKGEVKSLGLYEDVGLEHLLYMFHGSDGQTRPQIAQSDHPPSPAVPQKPEASSVAVMTPSAPLPRSDIHMSPPKVRTLLGRPIAPVVYGRNEILTGPELAAIVRYMDFIDLGLATNLFEKGATCFMEHHVPSTEWPKFATDSGIFLMKSGMSMAAGEGGLVRNWPDIDGMGLQFWKGGNEFEWKRTKQSFIETYRGAFEASAVKLPAEFVAVQRVILGEYSSTESKFPLEPLVPSIASIGAGRCGRLQIAPPELTALRWEVSPAEGERIINRIPNRRAYWGTIIELSTVPGEVPKQNIMAASVPTPRPLIRPTIKSIGLYEDPDLEKPLHMFAITNSDGK